MSPHNIPTQVQREGVGIAPTHSQSQRQKGMAGQHHTLATLTPEVPIPTVKETGWDSRQVCTGTENRQVCMGMENLTPP